ncbi:enoyl-CoA hydratase/isomerase family protein [Bradyrhizobium prioriisuperbiae]|uniref:enoyl-CoA hydratase/isomerase family protein n=1 Tax=Bradyrhizobium prioriisuperbiae TaxID=2854389 RepID=UPI0028E8E9D6|nr:enoyl-CoA hydratase/isomerase family protein [Bradyrhizobium prioritasuperba]
MIAIDQQSDVTLVTLARPPVNALDLPMIEELDATFTRLAVTPARAVVLTGAGQAFCAGVDTKAFMSCDGATRKQTVLAITRMTAALLALPCPLVAAVNGHALGGGFILMLCCDHRLAVDDGAARLGLTEARAGVPFPAGPVAIMKHEVPAGLLRQLTLSSRVLSPQDLVAHAVIDGVVERGTIVETAVTIARDLAAQPAFAVVKQQLRGALAAEVRALAASESDPFLSAFG